MHREQGAELGRGDPGGGQTAPVRDRAQSVRGLLQEEEQALVGLGHGPILTEAADPRPPHFTSEVRLPVNEAPGLPLARKILAAQPFSALLGARLTAFGGGEAILELDIRDDLLQQYGYVHGGVLGYAADKAPTFAAGPMVDARLVTAGFTIDHLGPAEGDVPRAHARVVRAGRTRVVCHAT